LRSVDLPLARLRLVGKPVKAGAAEIAANPRARSAVMRIAEKCADEFAKTRGATPRTKAN
jgi:16S rRNA (cytosine1402-N4)-methyltransferase